MPSPSDDFSPSFSSNFRRRFCWLRDAIFISLLADFAPNFSARMSAFFIAFSARISAAANQFYAVFSAKNGASGAKKWCQIIVTQQAG